MAITAYWKAIGGDKFLPGTISAADRFVRVSYFLESSPKYDDREMAIASVFSQMRSIGVPLGLADPDHPNISATLWRNVCDHDAKRYYFESAVKPSVFWVDLDKVGLDEGSPVKSLDIIPEALAGEVSAKFQKSDPVTWIKPS